MTRLLLCGGWDPSGRAGLLADLETAHHLGAQAAAVATTITAQGARFVTLTPPVRLLSAQLEAALAAVAPEAIKLGVVPDRRSLAAIVRGTAALPCPWVVDPVVRSSKGEPLSSLRRGDYLALAGPKVVLTPNLAEAAWLLGSAALTTAEEIEEAARALLAEGFGAVVLKGGHREGTPVDLVCTSERLARLKEARVTRGAQKRGSGCRFATALAVGLARGAGTLTAARGAKAEVVRYLRS